MSYDIDACGLASSHKRRIEDLAGGFDALVVDADGLAFSVYSVLHFDVALSYEGSAFQPF